MKKYIITICCVFFFALSYGQGWGILERSSTPPAPDGLSDAKFYYNTGLKELHFYDDIGNEWQKYTERIDRISGANAPNYVPTAADAKIAVNAAGELYYYNNGWFSMLGWGLQGNNPGSTDFLGTKNNEPLRVKSKNRESMTLDNNGVVNLLDLPNQINLIRVKESATNGGNLSIQAGNSYTGQQPGNLAFFTGTGSGNSRVDFIPVSNGVQVTHTIEGSSFGVNEASPTANLHVNGSIRFDQGTKNGTNRVLTSLDGNGNAEWKDINTLFYQQYDVVNSDVVQVIPSTIDLQDSKIIGNYIPLRVKGANKVCVTGFSNFGTAAAGTLTVKIQTGLGSTTKLSLSHANVNAFCQDLDPFDSSFTVSVTTLTGNANLTGFYLNIYQIN